MRPVYWYIDMGYYEMALFVFIRAIPFLEKMSSETDDYVAICFLQCWDEMYTKVICDVSPELRLLLVLEPADIDFYKPDDAQKFRIESLRISCLSEEERMTVLMYDVISSYAERINQHHDSVSSNDNLLVDEIIMALVNKRFLATRKRQ